jgi:glycosyltransferase involved in cell wall biosynthesis
VKPTLITITGDRPESFALCAGFVSRWRLETPLRWIVVDDGKDRLYHENWINDDQYFIRREPKRFESPQESFISNLETALEYITGDPDEAILFIEDDDYYHPDYLRVMLNELQQSEIVGINDARYYNLESRQFRLLPSKTHASLSATAIRGSRARSSLYSSIDKCKRERSISVDLRLWDNVRALRISSKLLSPHSLQVGIKGMPGRKGLGIGHRPPSNWEVDSTDFRQLQDWIGKDFALYLPFINTKQLDLFT